MGFGSSHNPKGFAHMHQITFSILITFCYNIYFQM